MIHHLFVDGAVVTVPEWGEMHRFPTGTPGYTPGAWDDGDAWFILDNYIQPGRWTPTDREFMPKEFLTQLMLLGIPIHE